MRLLDCPAGVRGEWKPDVPFLAITEARYLGVFDVWKVLCNFMRITILRHQDITSRLHDCKTYHVWNIRNKCDLAMKQIGPNWTLQLTILYM
jgi:hypothetical protein